MKEASIWLVLGTVAACAIAYFSTEAYQNYLETEAISQRKRKCEQISPSWKREVEAVTQKYGKNIPPNEVERISNLLKSNVSHYQMLDCAKIAPNSLP
ncbi:hypothetical protein LC608_25745 [Nostoc sp. XA010]|uniref:hypothetical protein n=1 Tax=unclassified Nostoc TaxID=2593658 RepID=UPI001E5DBDA1|nr:hypothetical protein [Nostoc sp. XA010]MCC5660318.1 hypothetical protein [Nostoc sp. XA010]